MSKEAMNLALEALEYWDVHGKLHQPTEEAITALRKALAKQPAQQEPWKPTEADYKEWWDRHGLHAPTARAAFEDAASLYLTAAPQPAQQEPTGMLHIDRLDKWLDASLKERKAQRTWADVPDEEIKILWIQYRAALPRYLCFANALLARAKEKKND